MAASKLSPGLYIIATPIGNLGDITLRALSALQSVDFLACEDTRHTRKLLSAFDLKARLLSYRDHAEREQSEYLLSLLEEGHSIGLVSDAGLPLMSDPGFKLLQGCVEKNIAVTVIPGASAITTSLCLAGLEPCPFAFLGFLPVKQKRARLDEWKNCTSTILLFEAPHKLVATLEILIEAWGNRKAVVLRELTKKFESAHRGTLSELLAYFQKTEPRGEITIAVEGADESASTVIEIDGLLKTALKDYRLKEAVQMVAEQTGESRHRVYTRALELKKAADE